MDWEKIIKEKIRKKIKVIAVVAALFILVLGSLTVYLGVVGTRYIANKSSEINLTEKIQGLEAKLKEEALLQNGDCYTAAQKVLNLDALVNTPLQESFKTLRQACLEQPTDKATENKEKELI